STGTHGRGLRRMRSLSRVWARPRCRPSKFVYRAAAMKARIWGCRGSLATPGPETVRYGGDTSCLEVRTPSGRLLVLDAGTGIRQLGLSLGGAAKDIGLLLTHMHRDYIEGI